MPRKSTPKPRNTCPICLAVLDLPTKVRVKPMAIVGNARSVSLRDTICAVTVVPILAPRITPAAWLRFISPALTKPTTMTVVAELD